MKVVPTIQDAYQLMHDGALALAEVEHVGMRIDVEKLSKTIEETTETIKQKTAELRKDSIWLQWKKRFGERTQMGSHPQLGEVLVKEIGHEFGSKTKTGKDKVDDEALQEVDLPFVKNWLEIEKLKKLKTTYLIGVQREVCDGYLHPSFNLHFARSFRSSCDSPNFQNMPIRDKTIGKMIRECFIPRPGHVLTENDFGALEFKGAACKWADPGMISYASDPTKDIHRDVAMACYMLTREEVTKDARYCGKNRFVFPELYGSDYINCSQNLWNAIESMKLKTADEIPLLEHLKSKGITRLGKCNRKVEPEKGTFERRIRWVENKFNEWFPEWSTRKERWWKDYQKNGYFDLMTGFRCSGVFSKNQLYNTPIQGPCFHILLWCLIQLVKELKKRKMKSVVIGQIHDSIVGDVAEDEIEDYFALVTDIMENWVREHWKWIIVPLISECEICHDNWWDKKPWPEK